MDIRRHRTRLRLHSALCELLADRPLSDISVEALAQRAGTTRQTFYSNYSGLTEMLEDYLSALLDEIEARHTALHDGAAGVDSLDRMRGHVAAIFADIDRQDPRLKALLEGVPSLAAETRFAALVERLMARGDPLGQPAPTATARRIQAHYFTGAFIGMLRLWVTAPEGLDAEGMATAFLELSNFGKTGSAPAEQG